MKQSLLVCVMLLSVLTIRAADDESTLVGTWNGPVEELKEVWTIKKDGDKWTVSAVYLKSGKEVGSFVGKEPKFAKGVLTFTQEYAKVPPGKAWKDGAEYTARLKGDKLSYTWKLGGSGTRVLSKGEGGAGDSAKQFVGQWLGQAEAFKEVWSIKADGDDVSVTCVYLLDDKEVGGFTGQKVKLANGVLTFVQKYDKIPEGVAWVNGATHTVKPDGMKLGYTWKLGISSGKRSLERAKE